MDEELTYDGLAGRFAEVDDVLGEVVKLGKRLPRTKPTGGSGGGGAAPVGEAEMMGMLRSMGLDHESSRLPVNPTPARRELVEGKPGGEG